jgi:hypothetical protein
MSIELDGVKELRKALENVSVAITDGKQKKKTLRKAAKPVQNKARQIAPKLKKGTEHYRYDTPKVSGKLRAPKGMGRRIATYLKGNLAGAIKVLSLRKSVRAVVGPFVRKRGDGRGTFGPGSRKFDAYYAQMVFGSAKAFQRKVMIAALNQTRGASVQVIEKELKKITKKEGSKNGLDVR